MKVTCALGVTQDPMTNLVSVVFNVMQFLIVRASVGLRCL